MTFASLLAFLSPHQNFRQLLSYKLVKEKVSLSISCVNYNETQTQYMEEIGNSLLSTIKVCQMLSLRCRICLRFIIMMVKICTRPNFPTVVYLSVTVSIFHK